jgi:hypothetical protein
VLPLPDLDPAGDRGGKKQLLLPEMPASAQVEKKSAARAREKEAKRKAVNAV